MQLNSTNGNCILIDKYDINNNRVIYSIFDFGGGEKINTLSYTFKNRILADYYNVETNFENLCLDQLNLELNLGFELSNDPKNWTIVKNVENQNTTLRVYLPAIVLNEEFNTGSNLDQLIDSMKVYGSQSQKLQNGSILYLAYIDENAKLLLEANANRGIIIDYK